MTDIFDKVDQLMKELHEEALQVKEDPNNNAERLLQLTKEYGDELNIALKKYRSNVIYGAKQNELYDIYNTCTKDITIKKIGTLIK